MEHRMAGASNMEEFKNAIEYEATYKRCDDYKPPKQKHLTDKYFFSM